MKILVRKFNDKIYEWVDAEYNGNCFVVDETELKELDVVSVMDDNRDQYVVCSSCGVLLKRGSEEIEEHKNKYKDCKACFDCKYLRDRTVKITDVKYDLQEDGTYLANKNLIVNLVCSASYWRSPIIHTNEARNLCAFRGCRNASTMDIEDIFTTNPGIFDDIITVDKIVEAGYKQAHNIRDTVQYRLKGRNEIYAVVNKMNIVDHFRIEYRGSTYVVYYSKKYNDFYYESWESKYAKWSNVSGIPTATVDYIKNKIAKLYE